MNISLTRRQALVKCGMGLVGIIASQKAPAALVKSALGTRNFFYVEDSPEPLTEVEWIESTGSSYYSFEVPLIQTGNNKDANIEWAMQLEKNKGYATLLQCTPLTQNTLVSVNSIDGINTVAGFNISKFRNYSTTFSTYRISRIANEVNLMIDGDVVYTTTGQYGCRMGQFNLFCRGDLAAYTIAPAGWKFGYFMANLATGDADIRAARIGRRGVVYDAIEGIVYESMGRTAARPGPDREVVG